MADTTEEIATSVVEEIQLEEDDLFHCKLLSIKVENRIFRVPRELLETYSDVYKDMFKFPVANDEPADGERDSAPLVLDGIKKEDFRAFLSVLSSLHYESMTKSEQTEKNVFIIARLPLYKGLRKEDWIAALRLSHMWNLENVRKKAIEVLESDATLGMIQRLKLANEFQITNWIRPAHRYLVMRTEDLKLTEVPCVLVSLFRSRPNRDALFPFSSLSTTWTSSRLRKTFPHRSLTTSAEVHHNIIAR
ncbi:hypothetical protein SCHPADRAFT_896892 [Schizopora paradoxa]|uniref:BTB domain-containing protein n=1 Tax=Schizopora paradoxa TaxID=27342 RepID=A0A0H2QYH4_9AGAM|nr:hypothetical protein SCHPADRAFT_896892 [Schizopora paradoxa]